MHEMSLCENLLQILQQQAQEQRFSRVRTVRLEIGTFACVEPESMQFSFEAVTHGTLAGRARLEIIQIPGEAWCMTCAQSVSVCGRYDCCPACGNDLLAAKGGDELRVKELEVE